MIFNITKEQLLDVTIVIACIDEEKGESEWAGSRIIRLDLDSKLLEKFIDNVVEYAAHVNEIHEAYTFKEEKKT